MKAPLAIAGACLALAACGGGNGDVLQGYVEGTFVQLSADAPGRVTERPVRAGQRVREGDLVFALDDADQRAALAAVEARLAQARAQLDNLTTGRREEEVAVIVAELDQARANLAYAEDDHRRKAALLERGITAQAAVDSARTARDTALAAVAAIDRRLEVARLPARSAEVAAAERNIEALEADVAAARHALDQRTAHAPVDALVEAAFFEVGERVAAGQPVASLLPDAGRKIRFFVPEETLAAVAIGDRIGVGCDGCADGLAAAVDFVAAEAEFTPPVIFSQESRDKLVFMVEATPIGEAAQLKVGQPIDIRLDPGA